MNLHRNNAAEWVMWACLMPFVPIVRVVERLRAARPTVTRKGRAT